MVCRRSGLLLGDTLVCSFAAGRAGESCPTTANRFSAHVDGKHVEFWQSVIRFVPTCDRDEDNL